MNEINAVLRRAAWRLGMTRFFHGLTLALAAAISALLLVRLGQQFAGLLVRWEYAAGVSAAVALISAVAYSWFTRPSRLAVAQRVDEGARLKEVLSTAMCVESQAASDPWARATVESATASARKIRVPLAIPLVMPRPWPVVMALGIALAISFVALPKYDLFKWEATRAAAQGEQVAIVAASAEKLEVEKLKEVAKKLGVEPEKDTVEATKPEPTKPQTAEEIRRSAIKELSKLNDRLEELRTGVQAQKLGAIQQQLKQLSTPGDKTSALSQAMAKGNFSQAKQELEKLKQEASAGEGAPGGMSPEQKKELATQLDDLAKQVDKLAQQQDALAEKLAQAGLDPGQAQDAASMKQALEQASGLSAEQKQQLSQAAEALSKAQDQMKGMSKSMQQMADAMKSGDQASMEKGAGQASEQLSEMEQMSQDLAAAAAAQSEASGQMKDLASKCDGAGEGQGQGEGQGGAGDKPWSEGWSQNQGDGSRGGGGVGRGGGSSASKADFEKVDRKSIGAVGDGPIVGTRLVEGDSIRGESRAQFASVVAKADQAATEAIENNTVPREYHNAIKNYFGRLQKQAAQPGAPAKDAPAAPSTPAAPAKDSK